MENCLPHSDKSKLKNYCSKKYSGEGYKGWKRGKEKEKERERSDESDDRSIESTKD